MGDVAAECCCILLYVAAACVILLYVAAACEILLFVCRHVATWCCYRDIIIMISLSHTLYCHTECTCLMCKALTDDVAGLVPSMHVHCRRHSPQLPLTQSMACFTAHRLGYCTVCLGCSVFSRCRYILGERAPAC